MPRARAVVIELNAAERRILRQRDRGGKTPWQDRMRADFTDLAQVKQRLLDFQDRYNAAATPFTWKFTAADLADVIARIDRHEPTPPSPAPAKTRTARKKTATTPKAA